MVIIPAIDIINQQPVRLYQGDYNKKEVVGQSILEIAVEFERKGAKYLHMVDLDGAKEGKRINQKILCDVAKAIKIPVEIGGGIRDMTAIDTYLKNGISRVILGTSAIEDEELLKDALAKYGDRIAIGLDCKDGFVCTRGWLTTSDVDYISFTKHLEDLGVKTIIFTDISKDGTLAGPNLSMLKKLKDTTNMNIIASGGIKDTTHIQQLCELGVYGAITGKAMYAGTLSLEEAIAISESYRCKR